MYIDDEVIYEDIDKNDNFDLHYEEFVIVKEKQGQKRLIQMFFLLSPCQLPL